MKAIVLSSFPLVDKMSYKGRVLEGLVERGIEVVIIYAATALWDYYREFRRRCTLWDVRQRLFARARKGTHPTGANAPLRETARRLGIHVEFFRRFSDPHCLRMVREYGPDFVHNLSALFIPAKLLEATNHRVIGGHYGDLPRLRGSDMIRWTILLDQPMIISHMLLSPRLDMGDIVAKTAVQVHRSDDVLDIRRKCQTTAAVGHLTVVDRMANGELRPLKQNEKDGSMFYRMGRFLKTEVDRILTRQGYSHYADG